MAALQRPEDARLERGGWIAKRLDHLVRALIALAALAEAAVDDLLQVIGAAQSADFTRPHAHARVTFDQHPEQLADLIHVISRLPLRNGARDDVARRGQRVHRARGDTAPIALLAHDPEVPQLQMAAIADEDVQWREIAVERVTAVQLAEDFEDTGDLAPGDRLVPALRLAREEGAEIAVARVFERQAVEDFTARSQ